MGREGQELSRRVERERSLKGSVLDEKRREQGAQVCRGREAGALAPTVRRQLSTPSVSVAIPVHFTLINGYVVGKGWPSAASQLLFLLLTFFSAPDTFPVPNLSVFGPDRCHFFPVRNPCEAHCHFFNVSELIPLHFPVLKYEIFNVQEKTENSCPSQYMKV